MKNKSYEEQVRIYKEVALHYGKDKTIAALARELGISSEEVTGAAFRLRKEGLDIPCTRLRRGSIGLAVKELSSEHPELFRKKNRPVAHDRISRILGQVMQP